MIRPARARFLGDAMAKVVALNGARPTGWARDRWAWQKAVWADADLSAMARLVASVLVSGYANHETGECSPGVKTLAAAVGSHRATIMRALAELVAAGWVERLGGEGPGKVASYRFLFRERVAEPRPERVATLRPERVAEPRPERVADLDATCRKSATPPIPPYKDEPNMNQKPSPEKPVHPRVAIRGMQRPQTLTHVIAPGSGRAERWNEWLEAHGYPPLERIGFMSEGGYRMPVSIAPSPEHETPYRIAIRWADWLRSRG